MSSVFLIALCIMICQLDLPGLAVITAMTSESLAKQWNVPIHLLLQSIATMGVLVLKCLEMVEGMAVTALLNGLGNVAK